MDYSALSELVMMALMGLSVLTIAVGFSVRLFLAPTLREIFGNKKLDGEEASLLLARLSQVEDRLGSIEGSLDRIADTRDFDRQLGGPKLD